MDNHARSPSGHCPSIPVVRRKPVPDRTLSDAVPKDLNSQFDHCFDRNRVAKDATRHENVDSISAALPLGLERQQHSPEKGLPDPKETSETGNRESVSAATYDDGCGRKTSSSTEDVCVAGETGDFTNNDSPLVATESSPREGSHVPTNIEYSHTEDETSLSTDNSTSTETTRHSVNRGLTPSPSEGWRPTWLRRRVFFGFTIWFITIAVVVEVLVGLSQRFSGLGSPRENLYPLWTFGPTASKTPNPMSAKRLISQLLIQFP